MKTLFVATLLCNTLFFASCTKIIDLNVDANASKLVIDGSVNNAAQPYTIKLANSVPFNSASIYPAVSNAKVYITDNTGLKDTLVETSAGIYKTTKLLGKVGNTYNLQVQVNGKLFEAASTMPNYVNLDSLKYTILPFGGVNQYSITPIYTDLPMLGNYYKFNLYVNGKLDKSQFVITDNVNNGVANQRPLLGGEIEIKKGDTVTVQMQCIDAKVYAYYYTLSQIGNDGGITPTNPPNNISNGALGIFSANTIQSKTIIIQ